MTYSDLPKASLAGYLALLSFENIRIVVSALLFYSLYSTAFAECQAPDSAD
jgi:hypothetical protein